MSGGLPERRVFFIAGELSGDVQGSLLIRHLREHRPDLQPEGVGGPLMRAAGMRQLFASEDLGVIGFVEVLRNLGRLLGIYRGIRRHLEEAPPDLLVLIDYPGFNLRIARLAKGMGVKVLYFILPQVWAWNRSRIPRIARVIDEAVVVFPFEVDIWRRAGVKVACYGHPLVGVVESRTPAAAFRDAHQIPREAPLIALLPGSRAQEIHYILPDLLRSADLIRAELPTARFLLPLAASIDRRQAEAEIARGPQLPLTLLHNQTYDAIAAADLALVASGTATLETALLGTPMVIVYQTNLLTSVLSHFLVQSEYIGLPNVIARREVVPEFVRWQFKPGAVSHAALQILRSPERRAAIAAGLAEVRERLGTPGAAARLARHIGEILPR